jgi:O-methyltransferase
LPGTGRGASIALVPGSASARLARLADGYLITQLLHAAIVLGVPEALADGPRDVADLAAEVGAEPAVLHRVLRGLAAEEVLEEVGDRRFGLTPAGQLLRAGVPGSLRGAIAARAQLYYAAAGLPDAVRSGGTPFELVHGQPFFAHLSAEPERLAAFQGSMAGRAVQEADAVVAGYDFSGFATVVDVGGGTGALLRAVRAAASHADVLLFDQPDVVARSPDLPTAGGNFFTTVPGGADAYLLSRVLHDWDDGDAARVLRVCRSAMRPDSVLLVVEAVLPDRAVHDPASVRMDLHMLLLLRGRERGVTEFGGLFAAAGLDLTADVPTPAGVHVLEARPRGAQAERA